MVTRQIKYEWDYLYGSLGVVSGEAHFAHLPSVSMEWDQSYLRDLAASDPDAIHVLVRDQAGFHLRDGDPRLPARVRIVDLPPYSPELNPCERTWATRCAATGRMQTPSSNSSDATGCSPN